MSQPSEPGAPPAPSGPSGPSASAPGADAADGAAAPYATAEDHLADELAVIRGVLVAHVQAERARRGGPAPAADLAAVVPAAREVERRVRASRAAGRPVPFDALARTFALTGTEQRVLWLLAALEVDPDARELAQYVVGDPGRPVADVGLVRRLVYGERGQARALAELGPAGRLARTALIELTADAGRDALALRRVRAADRVVELLHGIDRVDRALAGKVTLVRGGAATELIAPPALIAEIAALVAAAIADGARGRAHPVIVLAGAEGAGRRALLAAAAAARGAPVLIVDGAALPGDADALARLGPVLVREAALAGAMLIVADVDRVGGGARPPGGAALDELLFPGVVAPLAATAGRDPATLAFARGVVRVDVPVPDEPERALLWRRRLGDGADPDVVAWAAARYRVTPGVIGRAADAARARAHARGGPVGRDELHGAIRTTLAPRLGELAMPVTWRARWDDLVLPEDTLLEVRELVARVRHRRRVHDEWGFGAKLGKGLGLSALFYGPPGTGKTMVAGLIAGELGLDLYQIDLSRVVSKWVGETEKNLASLFDAAEAGHAILLFDEADSLFAKRTDVKSSVDRYANLEVNYLLQRIEAFAGITILTTNHDTAIDEAFRRRLAFRIQFAVPEEDERRRLWRELVPAGTPLDPDVDFAPLAAKFAMTGGYIRNAVLRAAFLAADEDVALAMRHLGRAAALEYAAMGKVMHHDARSGR